MSLKPIQIPSTPIKPNEESTHHQVGTWTLHCTTWNQTTEILITPSFEITDSVPIGSLPNVCCVYLISNNKDKGRVISP